MPLNELYQENMHKICHETKRNYPVLNLKATKISKLCVCVLFTWPWRLPEEWPEACGSLAVVGAGIMHDFGSDPIRNPTIWLVGSRNQVNWFSCRGNMYYQQVTLHMCTKCMWHEIHMAEIRRSHERLIFIVGISIPCALPFNIF